MTAVERRASVFLYPPSLAGVRKQTISSRPYPAVVSPEPRRTGARSIPNQLEEARAPLILSAMSPAKHLQARIRADLKLAIVERRTIEVRALRSLLAAIDDAQAVPVGDHHDKYVVRAFGDAGVEVPRLNLSADALDALLRQEQGQRSELAAQMSALGEDDRALMLKEEAAIFARYIAS